MKSVKYYVGAGCERPIQPAPRSTLRSRSATFRSATFRSALRSAPPFFSHAHSPLSSVPPDFRVAPLRFPLRSRSAHMLWMKCLAVVSTYHFLYFLFVFFLSFISRLCWFYFQYCCKAAVFSVNFCSYLCVTCALWCPGTHWFRFIFLKSVCHILKKWDIILDGNTRLGGPSRRVGGR